MEKLIITAAICGAEVTKEHNPAVPYTKEEMVREAKSAYDAGAAVIRRASSDSDDKAPAAFSNGIRNHLADAVCGCRKRVQFFGRDQSDARGSAHFDHRSHGITDDSIGTVNRLSEWSGDRDVLKVSVHSLCQSLNCSLSAVRKRPHGNFRVGIHPMKALRKSISRFDRSHASLE